MPRCIRFWNCCVLAFVFALPCGASAEVRAELTAHTVVPGKQGKETLKVTEEAQPGDVIEYAAVYFNDGDQAVTQLRPVLPIPAGMELLPDTAAPQQAEASLDGQRFAAIPLKRPVKRADGRTELELVPYAEYRYLRWQFQRLDAGARVQVKLRAVVAQ